MCERDSSNAGSAPFCYDTYRSIAGPGSFLRLFLSRPSFAAMIRVLLLQGAGSFANRFPPGTKSVVLIYILSQERAGLLFILLL